MKTFEEMQSAIDAIHETCNQHGVVLIGVCFDEGIHGEIQIIESNKVGETNTKRITNKLEKLHEFIGTPFIVKGIGTPTPSFNKFGDATKDKP